MLAILKSVALSGIDAQPLEVEVDISQGIPGITIVGLPDVVVKESKDRVKAAVNNSNFQFPFKKLTVNLAPADIRKEGPSFDLPIAVGTLMASEMFEDKRSEDYMLVGELSLEGRLRPIRGALSMAITAREEGVKGIVLPEGNACEAAVVEGIDVIGVSSLIETVDFLSGLKEIEPSKISTLESSTEINPELDFRDVAGQEYVKRAMVVAAAGGHNIIMIGPPGSGKTMLAQRLSAILPVMSLKESLDTTRIYSVAGLLRPGSGLLSERPFRSPHHTISDVGLIGGGAHPRPGEISLSNNGVLFLDEIPEFQRRTLEVLRQPLEDRLITIGRATGSVTYPANFMMVASMNPCPCGYFADKKKSCHCTPGQIERYVNKISGPMMDRIDLHVEVDCLDLEELPKENRGASSNELRQQVIAARNRQQARFKDSENKLNSNMNNKEIKKFCKLQSEVETILVSAMKQLGLSARAYHRVIKVARSIADLDAQENINESHVAEAIGYRSLDRKLWMP
jgi:magnesium chelatase family protein